MAVAGSASPFGHVKLRRGMGYGLSKRGVQTRAPGVWERRRVKVPGVGRGQGVAGRVRAALFMSLEQEQASWRQWHLRAGVAPQLLGDRLQARAWPRVSRRLLQIEFHGAAPGSVQSRGQRSWLRLDVERVELEGIAGLRSVPQDRGGRMRKRRVRLEAGFLGHANGGCWLRNGTVVQAHQAGDVWVEVARAGLRALVRQTRSSGGSLHLLVEAELAKLMRRDRVSAVRHGLQVVQEDGLVETQSTHGFLLLHSDVLVGV